MKSLYPFSATFITRLSILFVLFLGAAVSHHLQAQTYRFANASIPVGVEVDNYNNVHVFHDNLSSTMLTKYSSSGQVRNRRAYGSWTSIGYTAKMARMSSGYFLGIFPNGDLALINPGNGSSSILGNLRQTPMSTSNIYDVAIGRFHNMGGTVQPSIAHFGDIAVYERSSDLYVFITAISARIPFVVRLHFNRGNYRGAKVVVASSGASMLASGQARGIAVNKYGRVLTTLPYIKSINGQGVDAGVTFNYNFTSSSRPQFILRRADMASLGMAADNQGNFYVATGSIGTSMAGARGSGAILKLNSSLTKVKNIFRLASYSGSMVASEDVAVSPDGRYAYVTVSNYNSVYKIRIPSERSMDSTYIALDSLLYTDQYVLNTLEEMQPDALEEPTQADEDTDLQPDVLQNKLINTENIAFAPSIRAYPNPTVDWLQISLTDAQPGDYQLFVTNLNGRRVLRKEVAVTSGYFEEQVDLSGLPAGSYLLLMVDSQGRGMSEQIIKR